MVPRPKIDVEARVSAIAAITRFFLRSETTNFQFMDDEFPNGSKDAAVRAIFWMLWGLYDDIREHKIDGKYQLTSDDRVLVDRCISFLLTDLEYEWPGNTFSFRRIVRGVTSRTCELLHLKPRPAALSNQLQEIFADAPDGNAEVWPFYRTSDYRNEIDRGRT